MPIIKLERVSIPLADRKLLFPVTGTLLGWMSSPYDDISVEVPFLCDWGSIFGLPLQQYDSRRLSLALVIKHLALVILSFSLSPYICYWFFVIEYHKKYSLIEFVYVSIIVKAIYIYSLQILFDYHNFRVLGVILLINL